MGIFQPTYTWYRVFCKSDYNIYMLSVFRPCNGWVTGILRFYTDDAPGLRIGPTVVLVFSLAFIGCVVLLHIWGKFKGWASYVTRVIQAAVWDGSWGRRIGGGCGRTFPISTFSAAECAQFVDWYRYLMMRVLGNANGNRSPIGDGRRAPRAAALSTDRETFPVYARDMRTSCDSLAEPG